VNYIFQKAYKVGMRDTDVASLELEYIKRHEGSRKWKVYELEYELIEGERIEVVVHPQALQDTLQAELDCFFKHLSTVLSYNDVMWIRIGLDTKLQNVADTTTVPIFGVYYPQSHCVFIAGLKGPLKPFIINSLQCALKCHKLSERQMYGNNIESLKELLFNKGCQGSFKKYQMGMVDNNPLDVSSITPIEKQKAEEKLKQPNFKNPLVVEDQRFLNYKIQHINRIFGSQNRKQPKLDTLEFIDFKGEDVELGLPNLTMTTKFRGTNILEGIRECIKRDIAVPPLPIQLEELHSLGQNIFVFSDQK